MNFPELEKKILGFWQRRDIFRKTLEKTRKGPRFVFFEGPPFANGLPGIHHLLARAFKDIILRYKTMQGFYVERKAGWDTHGLPTEMEAEKRLGIKSKKEIEKLGIEKFIEQCKKSVFIYKKEWEEFTERIGFWLDLKNAYITCSNEYIESLWWILKRAWDKGLLYQDYKVVPYCPRCGTSLSSHEVAQGYKIVKENSVYVKLPVKREKDTHLLIWTTTPWTLPGNVALVVNEKFDYVKIKFNNEYLILAKERLGILERGYELTERFKGKDLLGLEYEPLFKIQNLEKKAYFVVKGDFVSLEEGTGIVHMAPAFGEDDMEVGKANDLPVLMTVDEEGKFKPEVKNWAGMFVKDADPLIIEDLKKRGLLFKEEMYEHDYPFCWRCDNPLLYYAKTSWFIKMSALKEKLIENNKKINWVPEYLKEGRFGEWLKEIKDWNLSRERFWGTPLPIWQCHKNQKGTSSSQARTKIKNQKECNNIKVIDSIKELEKLSGKKITDLHRPFIDKITFKCDKCGGVMRRVPEVVDCWFDSGSMPFAQWHYPFKNKEKIDKAEFFPADFICEGIDQTRGWFYTLLAVSTLLDLGSPYKNVISHGIVLDAKSQKMSKSKGNVVWPKDVIDEFGADCSRFYFYTTNPVAEPKRFNFKDVQNLYRKFFDTLWQSYIFFSTYISKNFKPKKNFKSKSLLDQWIVSRLESLNSQVIKNLNNYNVVSAGRLFLDFVDDLSNWYIRRSRPRFQKPKIEKEKEESSQTLYYVISKLIKLLAPFTPFISEEIFQNFKKFEKKVESVHLCDYSKPKEELINKKLEEKMEKIREIVTSVLAERVKLGIKVRQPLARLKIKDLRFKFNKELLELIKEEVNVKNIVFDSKIKEEIELDTKITKDLKEEGIIREVIRQIQEMRKRAGLTPKDKISIQYFTFAPLNKILIKYKRNILNETKAKDIKFGKVDKIGFIIEKEIKIDSENLWLAIKKII